MKKTTEKNTPSRKIDLLFAEYAQSHVNPTNKLIHWICIPLIVLSIVALLNALPFPYLKFLGAYNSFINWFTIVLAFVGYYYYTLSPILMWTMLLIFFGMQGIVIELEKWQANGGLQLWKSSLILFVIAWIGQFIGHHIEGKKPSFLKDLQFLLIGPLWLLHFIFKKLKIKY